MKKFKSLFDFIGSICIFMSTMKVIDLMMDAFERYGALSIIPYGYLIIVILVSGAWINSMCNFDNSDK